MDQNYTSDEQGGRKLLPVGAGENLGIDNPVSISEENNTTSENQLKQRQTSTERSPLIRPRRPSDLPDDTTPDNSDNGGPHATYGSIPQRRAQLVEEPVVRNIVFIHKIKEAFSQPVNSVMSFLLLLIIGIVLVFAANLKTDNQAVQVKPQHVHVYVMLLMLIFIVWTCVAVIPQKIHYSRHHYGTLIPRHLLTGIAIFGTASTSSQVLLFLDFIKCSRHVDNLSYVYAFYPLFRIAFVYFQIYFFYLLSRDGILHSDRPALPGGKFFVMVTLATNLCIWASVFFYDASQDPKLRGATWLNHYYYGVENLDECANASLTSSGSLDLHLLVGNLSPYTSAFSMEYVLLASGLLLHIWMVIKSPIPKVPKPKKEEWTLWRFGFILGLLSIPVVFVAYTKEQTSLELTAPKVMLYGLKAFFFLAPTGFCFYCVSQLSESSDFVRKIKPVKLEVVLLGISAFLGFPAFDLACIFAAICEWGNYPFLETVWYGISYLAELFSVCIQFYFIKKAYQYKLPDNANNKVKKAALFIRQYASFAMVVSIAYWAAKTYELRRTWADPSIAEQYFGKYSWFALSHFSGPLCIFFYFHLAICYANIVSSFSQFGPLWLRDEGRDVDD